MATWLAALAGLHLTVGRTLLLAAVAAGGSVLGGLHLAGVLGRPADPVRRYGWIAVAVLLGVVCGATATAARLSVRDSGPVRALVEERAVVTAELVVRDDPRPVRGVAGRPATLLVPAELTWFTGPDGRRVATPAHVLVLATDPAWRGQLPGQRLTAEGRLAAPRGGDLTAAVLSAAGPPVPHGAAPSPQRAAGSLRAGLQRACLPLPDEQGGLLPGLVVGDTSRLPPTVEEDFLATGMTHLNAVSGSNVAIVVGAVLLLARWARAGPWLAAGLCGLALVGFVILVRPSPSVVRAATMGAIGLAALAAGRPRAALPALSAGVAVLVLVDPELAGDAGFALSVLATGGLLLLAPRWRDGLRRRGVPAGLAEALAVPAAAQLACAPVVAGISGTVSLVAVPANLLAVPAIAPATVLGVLAAAVSPVWPAGAEFVAWLASWPAWWLVMVARHGARLPAGTLPWPGGVPGALLLTGLTVALLVATRHPVVRRLVAVVVVAVVVGTLPVRLAAPGWPRRAGWSPPARSARATPSCCRWRPAGRWWSTPGRTRGRRTAACVGWAYGRSRCWWSATSTSTTPAAWRACSGVDRWVPCSPRSGPSPPPGGNWSSPRPRRTPSTWWRARPGGGTGRVASSSPSSARPARCAAPGRIPTTTR